MRKKYYRGDLVIMKVNNDGVKAPDQKDRWAYSIGDLAIVIAGSYDEWGYTCPNLMHKKWQGKVRVEDIELLERGFE